MINPQSCLIEFPDEVAPLTHVYLYRGVISPYKAKAIYKGQVYSYDWHKFENRNGSWLTIPRFEFFAPDDEIAAEYLTKYFSPHDIRPIRGLSEMKSCRHGRFEIDKRPTL